MGKHTPNKYFHLYFHKGVNHANSLYRQENIGNKTRK